MAVFPDIKKVGQHTHAESLSKTARTSDQCYLSGFCFYQFFNQFRFINKIISIFAYFRKIRNTNRNIQICHLVTHLFIIFQASFWVYDTTK